MGRQLTGEEVKSILDDGIEQIFEKLEMDRVTSEDLVPAKQVERWIGEQSSDLAGQWFNWWHDGDGEPDDPYDPNGPELESTGGDQG